jgi:kinesin family protein 22
MKVVEAEVAKRLAVERRKDEEERKVKEREEAELREQQQQEESVNKLPSGLLTPLLKRHRDLDEELRQRLQDLERKL